MLSSSTLACRAYPAPPRLHATVSTIAPPHVVTLVSSGVHREGRLLRRFLTMAQAKKSPPSLSCSSAEPPAKTVRANSLAAAARGVVSSISLKGSGSADATARTSDRRTEVASQGGGDEWEGDGAVGPRVVQAFINYFSKEVGVGVL